MSNLFPLATTDGDAAPTKNGQAREVPIAGIRLDGGTQPREHIDTTLIDEYAADMQAGDTFPPLGVIFDGKEYWLWDGFHRYHAARKAGKETITCKIREGTVRDAVLLSLSANRDHGKRRGHDDVRNAIERMLRDEEWVQWSDSWIGELVGCHNETVTAQRVRLESVNGIRKLDRLLGKDGQWYPRKKEKRKPTPTLPENVTLDQWKELSAADQDRYLHPKASDKKFNDQADNENIEWALWSWNPVTGCKHDCPYCYARDLANRYYRFGFEPALWPERLLAPRNTPFPEEKAAQWMGHKNVFTCSMADLFGRWVPREWIDAVLDAVRDAPQWNFLFLTKFPVRMAEFDFPPNAWVGTTVDCQVRVANAERSFRKVKASVKWLSVEPMIEPLTFTDLAAFSWLVIGGSSQSTKTPEWHPPDRWVTALKQDAYRAGVRVYEKSNLRSNARVREYPGIEPSEVQQAPEALRYLPAVESK